VEFIKTAGLDFPFWRFREIGTCQMKHSKETPHGDSRGPHI
jgi:hypothetical protein